MRVTTISASPDRPFFITFAQCHGLLVSYSPLALLQRETGTGGAETATPARTATTIRRIRRRRERELPLREFRRSEPADRCAATARRIGGIESGLGENPEVSRPRSGVSPGGRRRTGSSRSPSTSTPCAARSAVCSARSTISHGGSKLGSRSSSSRRRSSSPASRSRSLTVVSGLPRLRRIAARRPRRAHRASGGDRGECGR